MEKCPSKAVWPWTAVGAYAAGVSGVTSYDGVVASCVGGAPPGAGNMAPDACEAAPDVCAASMDVGLSQCTS